VKIPVPSSIGCIRGALVAVDLRQLNWDCGDAVEQRRHHSLAANTCVGVMHCSFDFGCLVSEFGQWATSEAGRQSIWQFLKDMAAILGVALTFLKWWESREAYIFGKLSDVLGDQSTQTRDAVCYVVQRVRRPGPADPPRTPVFAEQELRRLFSRHHWKPV